MLIYIDLYCPLLKRMQTCTARVESLNTREDGRGKHTDHVKYMRLCQCVAFFLLVVVC
jgi:hypothetical protein